MRAQLRDLSRDTVIYGASTVVGRFLNFLLVPFYVNVLRGPAEYGMATALYAYIGFLNVVTVLGLEAAYLRYAARAEKQVRPPSEERALMSTPFWVIFLISAAAGAVLWMFAGPLAVATFRDPRVDVTAQAASLARLIRLGALIVLVDSISTVPFAELRLQRRAVYFASLKLAGIVAALALNLLLVLKLRWGVFGIFVANLASSGLVFAGLLPVLAPRLELAIRLAPLRKMVPFGLANVPAGLGAMMVQVIDRPIVQAYLGLAALGVYQANYRMGFIMMVFVGFFEYAWRPFFLQQSLTDDARARIIFSRVFTYCMLAALFMFLTLSFGLPYLLTVQVMGRSLLRPAYQAGMNIIPVVLLAYVFQGAYTNFIAGIYIKERNRVLPFVTLFGAAINILANLALVPRGGPFGGLMGAALATFFAYLGMAGALYWQAQKVYPIAYDWPRVGRVAAVTLGAFFCERALIWTGLTPAGPSLLLARCALLVGAPALLYASGFFSEGERRFLRETVLRVRPEGSGR